MDPSTLPPPRRAPPQRLLRTSPGRQRRHKRCSTLKEQALESEYARDYQREWELELRELPTANEMDELSEIDEVEDITQSKEVPETRACSFKIEQSHPQLGSSEETRARSNTIAVARSEKAHFSNLNTSKLDSASKTNSRAFNLQPRSYVSLDTLPQCRVDPSTMQYPRDIMAKLSAEGPLARLLAAPISSLLNLPALSGSSTHVGPEECNQSAIKPQALTLKAVCPVEQRQNTKLSGSIADELDHCIDTITEVTGRITDQQQLTGTLTRSKSRSDKDLSPTSVCRLIELQPFDNSILNSDPLAANGPPVPKLSTKTTKDSRSQNKGSLQSYSLLVLPQTNQSTPQGMPQIQCDKSKSTAASSNNNSVRSSRIQNNEWDALQRGLLDWKWDTHADGDSDVESDVSSIAND